MVSRIQPTPLIVEPHPQEYSGYPFITLVQYRRQPMLVIVDNATPDLVHAFVLDLCGPEGVDEQMVISIALEWHLNSASQYPVSIEFSRAGLTREVSKIYRSLNVEFISRVIGPVPLYDMVSVKSVKKRRRKPIPLSL